MSCADRARESEPAPCSVPLHAAQAAALELPEHGPRELEAVAALTDLVAAFSPHAPELGRRQRALERAHRAATALGWRR